MRFHAYALCSRKWTVSIAKPTQEEIRANLLQTAVWTIADIDVFSRLKTTREFAFATKSRFPPGAFRTLSALPRLQFLSLTGSDLSKEDLADIARLPLLRHLFLNDCRGIDDEAIEAFACQKPARLAHFWLANTAITDRALAAIGADLPGVSWLDLSGTAITDDGMPFLQGVQHLSTLYLDRTAVTNEGLLCLGVLPRLNVITYRGTAMTQEGVDALLRAQIAHRRQTTSTTSVAADAALTKMETETLLGFMSAMKAWEEKAYRDFSDAEGFSSAYIERHRPELQAIFARFCTDRLRAYGHPNLHSVGSPTVYNPDQTEIIEVQRSGTNAAMIYTRERFGMAYEYFLKLVKGTWRVDHRKSQGDSGWQPEPL